MCVDWGDGKVCFIGLIGKCGARVLGKCEKLEGECIETAERKGKRTPKANITKCSPFSASPQ